MDLFDIKKIFEESENTKKGIPKENQIKLMNGNSQFILDLVNYLKIPSYTIATTAMQLCHYFFIKKSYLNYDRFIVCAACVLLALKIKDLDNCNRISLIIKGYHQIYSQIDKKFPRLDDSYTKQIQEKIAIMESKLLKTIEFNFDFISPFDILRKLSKKFIQAEYEEKYSHICRTLILDTYRTYACLCLSPEIIVIANILIVGKNLDIDPVYNAPEKLEFASENLKYSEAYPKWVKLVEKELQMEIKLEEIKDAMICLVELVYVNYNQNTSQSSQQQQNSVQNPLQMQKDDKKFNQVKQKIKYQSIFDEK